MKKLLLALSAGMIIFAGGCGDDSTEETVQPEESVQPEETKKGPAHILTQSQLEELLKTKSAEQIFKENLVNEKSKNSKDRYCIDADGLRFLLKNGLAVDVRGPEGKSILHVAAFLGDLDLVKELINKNADVTAKAKYGYTVLHSAAEGGVLEVVKYLVEEKGMEINLKVDKKNFELRMFSVHVLHSAALSGNLEVVKYLIDKGADIRAMNTNGSTVLHYAAQGGNLDMVKYLIEEKRLSLIVARRGGLPCFIMQRGEETLMW